ncbi:MAG: hypothetical protein Q7R46_00210 [bacterium]|nr:hypothetical protein [bacterium]
MLTIFALPRPFIGEFDIIQRNAIKSWTLLKPKCEIILFGNEKGTAEAAKEFGAKHMPEVKTNENGTPLAGDFLINGRKYASYGILARLNADIILMSDFIEAIQAIKKNTEDFLMVGRRQDLDVREEIDFGDPNWEKNMRERVEREGKIHGRAGMDYWVFPKSIDFNPPPFTVGRCADDGWMIYQSRIRKIPVIDATESVSVIHQNHYYPQKRKSFYGREVAENIRLAGGFSKIMTMNDADWVFTSLGLSRPPFPRSLFAKLSLFYPWRLVLALKRKLQSWLFLR